MANRRGRTDRATATWHECQPAGGTAVAAYLRARGIGLPAAVERGGHLRFHAACPFKGQDGSTLRLPAMVALMTDPITGEPRAIHRTALKAEGSGKSDHPQLGDAKKMLGAAKGAVVRLSPDEDVSIALGLSEGIENGLAAICAGAGYPTWAACSADSMSCFPVLPGIETLAIFADTGEAGERAAEAAGERWAAAGREAFAQYPRTGDWNNALIRRVAA